MVRSMLWDAGKKAPPRYIFFQQCGQMERWVLKTKTGVHSPDPSAFSLNYALRLLTLCFMQPCREGSHLISADS